MEIEIVGSESLCSRARALIRKGFDPATLVVWTRGGAPVFLHANELRWWAARDVRESEGSSFPTLRLQRSISPAARDDPANDESFDPALQGEALSEHRA
jgi:hypothetical protein